jgi:UDP-N-acetylglucosamine transferase subunit ALG13
MIKINTDRTPPEKNPRKSRILVAPLDWGLGHATRCIPVIYELLAQNTEVWLAAEGAQEVLLKREFPELEVLHLDGYRVQYGGSGPEFLKTILLQTPRLFRTIRKERRWLEDAMAKYGFDAIISDNRFGLSHSSVPSVFITHQLTVRSPWGKWTERFLQHINYRFINRFSVCWIPDLEDEYALAGLLSHPEKKPDIPVYYIGLLSRLAKTGITEKKRHLFISLSGPEPQRTLFENRLIDQISHFNGTATIVRGLPGTSFLMPSTNDIRFYNHLTTEEYNREMEQAEYVISRSGYSTVMDLVRLGKKSILVPTPGQTEQEYLAVHLEKLQIACWSEQEDFVLETMLQKAERFNYRLPSFPSENKLANTIALFLESLRNSDTAASYLKQ